MGGCASLQQGKGPRATVPIRMIICQVTIFSILYTWWLHTAVTQP